MIDLTVNLWEQGFRHWCYSAAPSGVLLEVVREGEAESCLLEREDISPLTNVGNLYWRLTGQAREQLGWDWGPGQGIESMGQGQMLWDNTLNSLAGSCTEQGTSLPNQAVQDKYWKN